MKFKTKQEEQCTYDVILGRLRESVVIEKQLCVTYWYVCECVHVRVRVRVGARARGRVNARTYM